MVIEDRAGMAVLGQVVCGSKPGRPAADDRHALAGRRPAGRLIGASRRQINVGHRPMEFADRDRSIEMPAAADFLARRRANPPQYGRQDDVALGRDQGLAKLAGGDLAEHLRDVHLRGQPNEQGATQSPR